MRVSAYVLIVATLGLTTATSGQQAADPTPRFRSSARLVQVSVVVRDRRNRPVEDVGQAAFRIFEDGQEQPIAFFLPASRSVVTETVAPTAPATAPHFTNRIVKPGSGGVLVIVFDQLNSSATQQVR